MRSIIPNGGKLNTLLARLLIGSAIPLILFLTVGLVSGIVISRLLTALRVEKHSYEVINQARLLQQNLETMRLTAESGQPKRFASARDAFGDRVGGLTAMVADNDEQDARLRHMLELTAGGMPAPERLAEVEEDLDAFIEAEQALLAVRRQRTEEQTNQSLPVIGLSAALVLVLMILFSLAAARSVTRPVNRLREAARQLLAGRFQSVPPTGPEEISELIVWFNHMALTLSQRNSILEEQKEQYRTYMGAVAHILWTADATGLVVADQPTWRGFTGQTEDEILGEGWLKALHAEDHERVVTAWRQAVEARSVYEVECRLRSSAGDYRHFACRGVPIMADDGQVREWVGTCTDVTESRQRAALEQARDAAEAASRAKSEFLTRMSHELRTPLNAVIGMSKMLTTQRFGPLNAKQADYITDITRAGEHLLILINDVLDLAKVEVGKMEIEPDSFGLADLIRTFASTLRPLAEAKGLALVLEPPPEDGELRTDPARFRQVMYNLLSNAIKFTQTGGVRLGWQWVEGVALDAPTVAREAAGAVRLSVRDTGVGIAPQDQESVWDEFRQVRHSAPEGEKGTGLGLALTRRLVGLLGGDIGMESSPSQGSTFTVVLPLVLTPPSDEPCAADDRPLALVVEDHGPTCRLLCDWLNEAGLATASANDGLTGLEMARERRPALIVLDINLPKLDGWQVLTELKSHLETASIPVVIVTVNEQRQPASSFAVQEYFLKPISREAFLGRLREVLPALFEGGRPLRVLVVDDDPITRKLLADLLHGEGAEVREAANGREALERLAEAPADLMLLDLLMPEMDGFAVVEEARARPELATLPIVVVTGSDFDAEDRGRLQGRIQAFLQKSLLTPERLREHLMSLGVLRPHGSG